MMVTSYRGSTRLFCDVRDWEIQNWHYSLDDRDPALIVEA